MQRGLSRVRMEVVRFLWRGIVEPRERNLSSTEQRNIYKEDLRDGKNKTRSEREKETQ